MKQIIKITIASLLLISCTKAQNPAEATISTDEAVVATPKEEFTITVLEPKTADPAPSPTPVEVTQDQAVEVPTVSQVPKTPEISVPKSESQEKILAALRKENEMLKKQAIDSRLQQNNSIEKLKSTTAKQYFVIVGSFKKEESRSKMVSLIESKNLPVVTTEKMVGDSPMKSVKSGPFSSKEEATTALQKLSEDVDFPKDAFVK